MDRENQTHHALFTSSRGEVSADASSFTTEVSIGLGTNNLGIIGGDPSLCARFGPSGWRAPAEPNIGSGCTL